MEEKKRKAKARGNGQGTAYKRKNAATWTASVVIGWRTPEDDSKKPIPIKRTKAGFATKKDAIAYCPILLAGGIEKRKEPPRLMEYWDLYKDDDMKKLSSSKQTAYRIAWGKLKRIHDMRVDAITVDLMRQAVADKCSTYYTARDCRSLLTNLYKLAGADGYANKDLPSFINLPTLEETEREAFSDIEQTALWKLYEKGDKRAAIPLLMIYTGMMPGEAMGLKVSNIDLQSRTIVNAGLKTKVRKATPIVIPESIVPVVDDLIANAQPSGYIFKRVEDDWYAAYYAALEAANCRRLTPYCCRHTTATALAITEGIAPQTVRRIMRWSTTRMLDRYAHPETADALTAINTLKKTTENK